MNITKGIYLYVFNLYNVSTSTVFIQIRNPIQLRAIQTISVQEESFTDYSQATVMTVVLLQHRQSDNILKE